MTLQIHIMLWLDSLIQLHLWWVLVEVQTGIDTSVGLGTAIGGFSWGRLTNFNRSANPISIGVTGKTHYSGISSYPTIQRRDFGLRDSGALRKDLG